MRFPIFFRDTIVVRDRIIFTALIPNNIVHSKKNLAKSTHLSLRFEFKNKYYHTNIFFFQNYSKFRTNNV